MEGRLLVIKRHCERRKTEEDPNVMETLRGDWILEPEDDPNSIGTPLTEAQIPKNPPSLDIPLDDADHEAAELSVDDFLLWEMNQPRFRPTGDWEPWGYITLAYKKTHQLRHKWTETFEVIIVRDKRRNK